MDINVIEIKPYTNHELWSPEKFLMPPRSPLHHLEPIGVGTPTVESLTSYVTRLAQSHGVFVSTLLSRIVNPLLQRTFIKDSTSRGLEPFFNRSHVLNGYGTIATDFVEVLNQLTLSNKLKFLTLISFSNILVAKGLLRPYKAWCPICYEHRKKNLEVIYEPLLWSLNDVKICLIHQHPLVQDCPHCYRQSPWLNWKSSLGYCSQCSQWLGGGSNTSVVTQERWIAETLGELVANAEQLSSVLTQEHIQKSFTHVVHQVTEGNIAAFAAMHKIPKNTFWGWYCGKNCPPLSALIQICYNFKISLSQFFTQDFNLSTIHARKLKVEMEYSKKTRSSPRTLDLNHIENTLSIILSQVEEPLPTITEIAEQLKINRRVLSRHFPVLCHKIVTKRRNYMRMSHLAAIEQCCQEIKEAIVSLQRSGEYPSESRVCELISNPGYFRYQQVRLLYKQELQSTLSSL
ncbi:TniQ family protein [Coleofasciculus sp. FACHB-SPT36]|uniref:TniQ family protein n=1 Tax=Cyanophyceae TaxID=3028117 RepID=UPI00168BF205|nr:TniQ family protein [Coleofasciculus sp. FACHB-SPT36]MBD2538639.1 TniQ family protein [Coleofasciculus sp. FACHB-SPT36]